MGYNMREGMKVLVMTGWLLTGILSQCETDGEYCFSDSECCSGLCSRHWPPTTTPIFGVCGEISDCQAESEWCREGWSDATCCEGLLCVNIDGLTWGYCATDLNINIRPQME